MPKVANRYHLSIRWISAGDLYDQSFYVLHTGGTSDVLKFQAVAVEKRRIGLYAGAHNRYLCVACDIDILSPLAHNYCVSDLARDPKQIGNLIRRARKRRGFSQGALGAKAALRQETISLIENGNGAAKLETILKVLSALDLEFRIAPRSKGDLGIETDF
jgi:HTH-type transcriptional regulator/antitoxin HipB